jgi:hypothetical protein
MSKQLARTYIGGGVSVLLLLDDDTYSVLVDGMDQYPVTRAEAPRERPALRLFEEAVAELETQFEAAGRRWRS